MFKYLRSDNDQIAIRDKKSWLSYSKLKEEIAKYQDSFINKGIKRVAIYADNSIEWCVFYLAAFVSNIPIFVFPISADKNFVESTCEKYEIDLILITNNGKSELIYMSHINEASDDMLEDVSTILFTSGTTGVPKGVMLTKTNILSNVCSVLDYIKFGVNDKIFIVKSLFHSSTLVGEFLAGIWSGSEVYINAETFWAVNVINIINREKITVMCGVPSMFALIINARREYKGNLRAVSISGSFACNNLLQEVKEFFNCSVYHVYGLSEASPRVCCLSPDYYERKIGSIGKGIKNVTVEIFNEEDMQVTAPYVVGELVVSGPNIMKGYLGDMKLTEEKLKCGKLYTGDLGYFDQDSFIYLVGRKDDMICRSGVNIYPQVIEAALLELVGVEEVVVFGIEDYVYSQKIVACMVTSRKIQYAQIVNICKIKNTFSPDEIYFVEAISKNQIGKVDRKKMRQEYIRMANS